MHSGDKICTAT